MMLPRVPPHVERGLQKFERLETFEKKEHQEVARLAIRKAVIAYDAKATDTMTFLLGCDPEIIRALCYSKFPIQAMHPSETHRIMRIKVMPNDLPIEPESSWCSLL